ncbi:MAG: hypothetical protein Q9210_001919 [Variospora velana]
MASSDPSTSTKIEHFANQGDRRKHEGPWRREIYQVFNFFHVAADEVYATRPRKPGYPVASRLGRLLLDYCAFERLVTRLIVSSDLEDETLRLSDIDGKCKIEVEVVRGLVAEEDPYRDAMIRFLASNGGREVDQLNAKHMLMERDLAIDGLLLSSYE